MDIEDNNNNVIKNHKNILVLIIITFILEFLLRNFLFSISIPTIIFLQKYFYYLYPLEMFFLCLGWRREFFLY